MGRPTDLTPDVHRFIVSALEAGATVKDAYTGAGIGESTYHQWRDRGRRELERLHAAQEAHQAAQTAFDKLPKRTTKTKRATAQRAVTKTAKQAQPIPSEVPFREFAEAVLRARARAKVGAVATIRRAMQGQNVACPTCVGEQVHNGKSCKTCAGAGVIPLEPDWRAAAWYLERTEPGEWGRRTVQVHEGSETAPPIQIVALDLDHADPAVREAANNLLRRRRTAG